MVLLLLQNPQDRKLFDQFLDNKLTVVSPEKNLETHEFDLCILDEKAIRIHRDFLENLKEQSAPVFLPILLLSQDQEQVQKNPYIFDFTDDVVYVPASTKLLQSRINMLLRQRRYSIQLQKKNRQLQEANKKLAREKKKYQLLTKNATDMISRHAPDGTYLYASEAAKEITGYAPEDLIGENAFDNIHPADREVIKQIEDPFEDGEVVTFRFRKQLKEGSYKWVETVIRPILDEENGIVTELQASTRDISIRKEYEQQLREEKEFIDKAIQSLPELFYMIDKNQNFIKWTNIERELGYTDEEVRNMHPLDFYQEKDHPFIQSKIVDALKTGSAETEVEMKAKSGDLIPYYITAQKFSRGDNTFIVGTCVNLTEIKETQFELEKQRQLLDAIINQTESLIYVKDEEGKYRLVNNSYLEFYNMGRDEVIGKTEREVHGQTLADQIEETDNKVLTHAKTSEFEETRSNKSEQRLYHTIKYPLEGVPGFENCMCGISTDITALKQASQKLQERIKEQNCLYNISNLPQETTTNTVDELLKKAVAYLPAGWQYPEITEAAITFGGNTYKTEGFVETDWKLSAVTNTIADQPLEISVVYTEEKEKHDKGPFLEEEQLLIDSISDTLSSHIERINAQKKLRESKKRWEMLVKNDPDLIQILVDRKIMFINQAGAKIYGADSTQEIIGKRAEDFIEIQNLDEVIQREQKLKKGEAITPTVHKIIAMDGKTRYIKTQSTTITYEGYEDAIQVVGQDITERIEYEQELKQSLKEKETLLQEIHHRVKNNLAVVSGMMELQTFNTENEEVKSLLADSKNRIKTMALIHEKLYQSESLSQIEFGSYVYDLLENIRKVSSVSDNVKIDLEYDSFNLNVNQAVPCALIINEVVSNAFEHAFKEDESGNINVSLQENGNSIIAQINDNGQGLPENFKDRKDKSIGFTIIETLLSQLNAEVSIKSKNGLLFSFSFEKQEIKGSSSSLV